uniref:PH01B035L11.6 protein n=1 Tax=Phyllostachys edulis TaxID=38705 RepID=L0P1P3_PHYED|nr:PH01B035L11.6 [Phyllostachys edulis]
MAGGNLFGRVFSYVVNEFLVEGLANNRAFQRFAVKTNRTLENLSSKAKEVREELSEQWRDARGHDDEIFTVRGSVCHGLVLFDRLHESTLDELGRTLDKAVSSLAAFTTLLVGTTGSTTTFSAINEVPVMIAVAPNAYDNITTETHTRLSTSGLNTNAGDKSVAALSQLTTGASMVVPVPVEHSSVSSPMPISTTKFDTSTPTRCSTSYLDKGENHEGQVKNSSCVDEYSSQGPGLEVKMCVIKLQVVAQGKACGFGLRMCFANGENRLYRRVMGGTTALRFNQILVRSSESCRLVTLGVCRHLDSVVASVFFSKKLVRRPERFVSGVVLVISGVEE